MVFEDLYRNTYLHHAFITGLRTLCIASAVLPEPVYEAWSQKYNQASVSMTDRDNQMDLVAETIEQNLTLIGATAIEDKLQEGVPECIATLMDAGLKLWVLTGDKMETAINIGFSCNLLTRDMSLILVRGGTDDGPSGEGGAEGSTLKQLREAIDQFFGGGDAAKKTKEEKKAGKVYPEPQSPSPPPYNASIRYALVIDGAALRFALAPAARLTLLELATRCSTVICCRVSPLQKAKVVELVKHELGAMCLAIGDGANDVSMIQAAHIGIGIAGEEGMQAVMASDYGIGQFRFLGRLLLVHGRWSYRRTAEMILNFFFKNVVWV